MRVGIFYFSLKDGRGRTPIHLSPFSNPSVVGYIRCEVVDAADESDALDKARPRHDETLMNTHVIEG